MDNFIVEINKRESLGKKANRKLRSDGHLPSIVYHKGEESIPASMPTKLFIQLAQQAKKTQIFTFKSNEKNLDGKIAIVREVQKDYVKNNVLHVDFQVLKENEEILVKIPLEVQGEAPGVKADGGILSVIKHDISVYCFPKDIPSSIVVDIGELKLNFSIHAKDLVLPKNVRLFDDPEEAIVSVVTSRATVEDAAATTPATPTTPVVATDSKAKGATPAVAAKAPVAKAPAAKAPAKSEAPKAKK